MALERLLSSLERDAAQQVDALLAAARARAERVTRTADEQDARCKSETLEARERAQRAAVELALARARRAARGRVLEARARLLEQVFGAARDRLPAAADSQAFRAALPARLAAARACLGDSPAAVRCAPALLPALRELSRETEGLALQPDPAIATGFVVASCDGALEVDETLERRLRRRRPALAIAVLRALEEQAS